MNKINLKKDILWIKNYYKKIEEFSKELENTLNRDDILKKSDMFLNNISKNKIYNIQKQFKEDFEYLLSINKYEDSIRLKELIKILLSQQIETLWYKQFSKYNKEDLKKDLNLYDFRRGKRKVKILFNYILLYNNRILRLYNSLHIRFRRFVNHPARGTQGLLSTKTKLATIAFINNLLEEINNKINRKKFFRFYVNSVLRTKEEQRYLSRKGYIAPKISSHMTGYAFDIERNWYFENDKEIYSVINDTLWKYFYKGEVNLLDEGTHWHICLNPKVISYYENLGKKWII